jgi:hypothetical protein
LYDEQWLRIWKVVLCGYVPLNRCRIFSAAGVISDLTDNQWQVIEKNINPQECFG